MRGAPAFLNDSNQSFIIATGHFSREAMTVLYLPSFDPTPDWRQLSRR